LSVFKPRADRCRNCDGRYTRKRSNHDFCSDNCRKEFWKYGGISAGKIQKMIEVQLKKYLPPVESRLAKKFADILRKYRQRVPSELQQMAEGNTTDILYSARCMCGEQFPPGSSLFAPHVQTCRVINVQQH